ncbi:MAG: hypothetical protein NVSMB65_18850 [Chloroflexota bacterium]
MSRTADDAIAVPSDTDDILERLNDGAETTLPLDPARALACVARPSFTPRPYQKEAVSRWIEAGGRGVVVLPTGAGKTVVAMTAMEVLGARTLDPR